VFTIAAPAFDILFIGCVSNTKIVYTTAEELTFFKMLKSLLLTFKCCKMLLEDGEARWRRNKRELVDACKTFKCCKMLLEDEDDETRPRGCKYPTPPCALAKRLPETTVRAYFRQIENASPTTNTFLIFSTNILCPCMYTPGDS